MTDLAHVLRQLPHRPNPALLAGDQIGDDAAVYRLSESLALVQTVDFFTPVVDDPYLFGRIAAANSLSDVYAMGAAPLTALNIVGFPIKSVPLDILAQILRGGAEKCAEAGVTVVGGHTVDDEEPKYGLAVTGTVHPDRFISGRGGRAGDLLVLTKPIGTGVIATALKAGKAASRHVDAAERWMELLNQSASRAMIDAGAHACSDITGYGLLGHLSELCRSSELAATIDAAAVPLLPGAIEYATGGFVPAGNAANQAAAEEQVRFHHSVDDTFRLLLYDPQTSGGLLVALPSDRLSLFRAGVGGNALAAVVGELRAGSTGQVTVR